MRESNGMDGAGMVAHGSQLLGLGVFGVVGLVDGLC